MSITGEFEPSPTDWVREQVDKISETGDTGSVSIMGRRVVMLTMRGGKTGVRRGIGMTGRVHHRRVRRRPSRLRACIRGGAGLTLAT